jgi:hypothetical protein
VSNQDTPEDRRREAPDGPEDDMPGPRQKIEIHQIELGTFGKVALFLGLCIMTWMLAKIEGGDAKLDDIRNSQAEEVRARAQMQIELMGRLSGVESEVQGLKSRTEKLEQEIRK